jgi:PAS domain S-box-containing protein
VGIASKPALVLVAASDDDRRTRTVELIEASGHRVLEALDGLHALAAATRYLPDLTIADALLPRLAGAELLARLQHNPDTADIPLLVFGDAGPHGCRDTPVLRSLASDDDLLREMRLVLARRTANSAATVTLRRAIADIRATAGDAGEDDPISARARAHQLANGVEEAMISVLVADDDARYVEANAAICALSGYSRDELLAMTVWDLTPEDRAGYDRRMWERFRRDGRFEGSYRIRRRTGETVTIRCASSANVVPGLHVSTMAPPRLLEAIRS